MQTKPKKNGWMSSSNWDKKTPDYKQVYSEQEKEQYQLKESLGVGGY